MPQNHGQSILETVGRFRKLLAAEHLRVGIILSLTAGFLLLAGIITTETLWYLSPGTRQTLLWITAGVITFGLFSSGLWVGILGTGVIPQYNDYALARRLGRTFPRFGDRIVNAIALLKKQDRYGYSASLVNRNLHEVSREVQSLDLDGAVPKTLRKRILTLSAGMVAFWLLVWLPFAGSITGGINRLAHPATSYTVPKPFTFQVNPGDTKVLHNEPVDVTVKIHGERPEEVFLTTSEPSEEQTYRLTPDSVNRYRHTFEDVRKSFSYQLHAKSPHWWDRWNEIRSPAYQVSVRSRPQIQSLNITLVPPAYSGLPERQQEVTSTEIVALKGTEIQLDARTNKPVKTAGIHFAGSDTTLPMDVSETQLQSVFTVDRDTEFSLHLADYQQVSNHNPATYRISLLRDEKPRVEILQPRTDVNLGETMTIPMVLRLQDDYGFSQLAIEYRIDKPAAMEQDSTWKRVSLPLESSGSKALDFTHRWDLNALNLSPRDVVNYRAVVWDNDMVSGPKLARSETRTARFPSLSDMYAQVNNQQSQTMDDAQEVREQLKQIKEKVDKLTLEMRKREEVTWQQQKRSEQVIQSHQELKKKLEEINRQLDKMTREAEKHQLFDEEVMKKMEELQKLFQDVMTPELEEALKRLQESLDKADPEEVRKAMEELQQSDQEFSQNLDRALELFKRVKIEQRMDEMVKRVRDLAKRQEEIAEQADSAGTDPASLSQKEKLAGDEYEIAERNLQELAEMMKEFENMPSDQVDKALEQAKSDSIGQSMRQAREHFQQGEMQRGKQQALRSQQGLQQLSEQLSKSQQALRREMMQEVLAEFRSVTRNVLALSQQQESLHQRTKPVQGKSPLMEELANDQQSIQTNLQRVVGQMVQLSQKTFGIDRSIGKALGESASNMQKALQNLAQRRGHQAAQHQHAAMSGLNKTARQLTAAMNSLKSQGSSTGFEDYLKRMQQLTGQQQGINQQSKQLGLQGRPTAARQKAMQELARRQMAARRALQQLQQQMQQSGGQKGLGDLGQISDDMKEVEKDLRQEEFTRRTLERQQKILSRMLDAQKSMRTRDYSKKRESEVAEQITRSGPSGLPADYGERRNMLQKSLEQALREGYSKSYEQVIRDYFHRLSQIEYKTGENVQSE